MPEVFSYARLLVFGVLLCTSAAAARAYALDSGLVIPANPDSAAAKPSQVSTSFRQTVKLAVKSDVKPAAGPQLEADAHAAQLPQFPNEFRRSQRTVLGEMFVWSVLNMTKPVAATATTGAQADVHPSDSDAGHSHSSHVDSGDDFDPAEPPDDDSSPAGELVHCSNLSVGFDDIGDMLFHLRMELYIGTMAAEQRAHQFLIEQRMRVRLEDRRFEKPPRA